MKKVFYFGLIGLALFEIAKVYFIMPMPGSQERDTIDLAYFLHTYRWFFRITFGGMVIAGAARAFRGQRKWIPSLCLLPVILIVYFFNFEMTADRMFVQPQTLVFKPKSENTLNDSSVVLAYSHGGESKAYPIRYILYHHQVRDTVGGKPIMVTYCNVCRTGRIYEPLVNGKPEKFRLVGMDHFNAMFEDETTTSWWQQATGKAITGSLKGNYLPELEATQETLGKFFSHHPTGVVMQPEGLSKESYDTLGRFEKGKTKGKLTRPDSLSWKAKSWIVGIQIGNKEKAYDWKDLVAAKIINDQLDGTPIVIALSDDSQSFAAFKRNSVDQVFSLRNDSLITNSDAYDFAGRNLSGTSLQPVRAYQEFWHSWKNFHPETEVFVVGNR